MGVVGLLKQVPHNCGPEGELKDCFSDPLFGSKFLSYPGNTLRGYCLAGGWGIQDVQGVWRTRW